VWTYYYCVNTLFRLVENYLLYNNLGLFWILNLIGYNLSSVLDFISEKTADTIYIFFKYPKSFAGVML